MPNSSKKKVLIVGTYSGLNKGDRLMQQVAADLIERCNCKPILSSPFPKIDRKFYKEFPVVQCRRRNLLLSTLQCICLKLIPSSKRSKLARYSDELNDYVEAELIIDTSGDMHTEDYGIHIAISHLFPLIYSYLLGKNYILLAQSIGPFRKLEGIYKWVLSKASVITARDKITFDYLKSLNLSNVVLTADLGFLMRAVECKLELVDLQQFNKNIKTVGICPSTLFFQKFSKLDYKTSVEKFCKALDRVAYKNNLVYVFLPHVSTPNQKKDDADLSKELSAKLKSDSIVVDSELTPQCIKYIASSLDALASFRMHCAIAALDSFVPTLIFSYSHKSNGLFSRLGLDEWVINNDDELFESLEVKLNRLLLNAGEVKNQMSISIPEIRNEARKNFEILEKILRDQ